MLKEYFLIDGFFTITSHNFRTFRRYNGEQIRTILANMTIKQFETSKSSHFSIDFFRVYITFKGSN